ncbi:LPS translocon maturation chaperone LptM [Erwinia sp. V71]|uniref:LPS translocon maturation chaperone LptM n=1 Tax=Erwinia sp. V71 TaxID=3369424 RepID=UPI003F606A1D
MNKIIGQLALALVLTSLAGCGLKGPLYFPPNDQPQQQQQKQTTENSTPAQTGIAD